MADLASAPVQVTNCTLFSFLDFSSIYTFFCQVKFFVSSLEILSILLSVSLSLFLLLYVCYELLKKFCID